MNCVANNKPQTINYKLQTTNYKQQTTTYMKKISDQELIDELKFRFEQKETALKELTIITEQLKVVNKKLSESESLKSHFLSNITNEIVNPFASILGLSRNIQAVDECKCDKVKKMAAMIYQEAFELDFQLKNIFAAAKIEAGEFFPEVYSVNIRELILSEIENFQFKLDEKQISLDIKFYINSIETTNNFTFKTDSEKISLVVTNLLDNAIKYSNAAGKIEIIISVENGNLSISVKDYGIGISKDDLQLIFDRFKRVDASINSVNRGHGLGLSIVKATIDLFDGSVDVTSLKNKNSHFTVVVPEKEAGADIGFAIDGNDLLFDMDDNEIL